jgi:hypothetical protein
MDFAIEALQQLAEPPAIHAPETAGFYHSAPQAPTPADSVTPPQQPIIVYLGTFPFHSQK